MQQSIAALTHIGVSCTHQFNYILIFSISFTINNNYVNPTAHRKAKTSVFAILSALGFT